MWLCEEGTCFYEEEPRSGHRIVFRRNAARLYGEAMRFNREAACLYGEATCFNGEAACLYGKATHFNGEAACLSGEQGFPLQNNGNIPLRN